MGRLTHQQNISALGDEGKVDGLYRSLHIVADVWASTARAYSLLCTAWYRLYRMAGQWGWGQKDKLGAMEDREKACSLLVVITSQRSPLYLSPVLVVPIGTSHKKEWLSNARSQLWHPLEVDHMKGTCASFQLHTAFQLRTCVLIFLAISALPQQRPSCSRKQFLSLSNF